MLWKELFGVTKSLISPRRLCCRREQDKAQAVTENEELRKKNKQLMQECEEVSENRLQLVGMLTPPFRFRPSNHRGRSGDGGGGILVAEELRPLERRGGSRYCFATFLASWRIFFSLTSMWSEFVCPANQHPDSTVKKKPTNLCAPRVCQSWYHKILLFLLE